VSPDRAAVPFLQKEKTYVFPLKQHHDRFTARDWDSHKNTHVSAMSACNPL
jgi:hypothetical protein